MSANQIPNAALYADPAGLSSLKQEAKTQSPQALREAARQFESLFTKMMLKSMREASFGDSMTGSDTTDFYQDMHDTQLAVELSKGRGMGLAEMLVQQLTKSGQAMDTANLGQGTNKPALTSSVTSTGIARSQASAWPPSSREDFIRQLKPHAEQAGRELGVDPDTLLAHAALETGWGRSVPNGADGACSFNLFGIKAGSRWKGDTVGVNTLEFEDGLATRRVERFRSYTSPADCFKDYAALLGNSDRYSEALGTGDDTAAFAKALRQGGYATDPDYARKLTAVADSLKGLLKGGTAAPLTLAGGEEP